MTRRAMSCCAVVATLAGCALPTLGTAPSARASASVRPRAAALPSAAVRSVRPVPFSALARLSRHEFASAPSPSDCRATVGATCYSPAQIRQAYRIGDLAHEDVDGRGTTIAIVVSFGSPTIAADLAEFDRVWSLPDPPSIRTITPAGSVPPFDPTNEAMAGWAYETTLDVQYAHAVAPMADILVVATPVSETEGVQGFPEIVRAENYVVDHGLADVISQSFGATEQTFPSAASIDDLRGAFRNARQHGVTVLAAAGDTGAGGYQLDQSTMFSDMVTSWPSSDPLVTSVGGTKLTLDAGGQRVRPDQVWRDGYGSSGGGVSSVFGRPAFQDVVRSAVGGQRGTPDVSMSAAVDGGVLVYTSYRETETGWSLVGGTSEATPLFAGLVALADQIAGHSLGDLNDTLYRLGSTRTDGLVDVTEGSNGFADIGGYAAGPGFDLASGWGTVDASRFVPALAAARR